MFHDVNLLIDFYASSLGQAVTRVIQKKIAFLWPNLKHQKILGIGYPVPYLEQFRESADRLIMAMPAAQGVVGYPHDAQNASLLSHEGQLPFPDCFFDVIFVCHTLENTESISLFLHEAWRVLADHGKIMLLVPNRKGLWSQFSKTPFGHGRPFTTRQIRNQLEQSRFLFLRRERILYFPPVKAEFILRYASTWEKTGHQFYRSFSGALLVEAQKNLYQECKVTKSFKVALKPQTILARDYRRPLSRDF